MKNKTPVIIIPGGNTIAYQQNIYAKFWREFIIACWRSKWFYFGEILHWTIRNRVRWIRDLNSNLGNNYKVTQVFMPFRHFADYDDWVIKFEKYTSEQKQDTILIGYSLGALFLVKYLSENPKLHNQIKHVFLAGTFYNIKGGLGQKSNFQFSEKSLDNLSKLPITFYHGAKDKIVPPLHFDLYKEYMQGMPDKQFRFFTDRGHIDKNYYGYSMIKLLQKYLKYPTSNDFPELIKDIKKI